MLETFSTIAVSIFLEGLFFLLIGVLISSIIEVFVSEETLNKFIPKNKFLALSSVSLLGLIFPICECGIVPVIHRLLKKGVPLHICITLLFSAPIVNIVVILSTYFAFIDLSYMVFYRFIGGVAISFIIGFIVSLLFKKDNILTKNALNQELSCSCCDHEINQNHDLLCSFHSNHVNHNSEHMTINTVKLSQNTVKLPKNNAKISQKIIKNTNSVLNHSILEFFDTSKYFIIGILITAFIQSTVPRASLENFGSTFPLSNIFMIFLPYVLSICSNTDAFIARSFLDQFNISALLCFMVFGAMFDIKTTIMLKKIFKLKFILKLLFFVLTLTLAYSFIIEIFLGGNNI